MMHREDFLALQERAISLAYRCRRERGWWVKPKAPDMIADRTLSVTFRTEIIIAFERAKGEKP